MGERPGRGRGLRQRLLLRKLGRTVTRKPEPVFAIVASHKLEMLAALDRNMLVGEGIAAAVNYCPSEYEVRPARYEVVVPEAFADQARQLIVQTRE